MAFFNDISKKISQVSQSAVKKTKDITDIAKINSAISDGERKLNSLYTQIGKQYVATHSVDCEVSFADLVNSAKETEKLIAEYRQQVQDIKGVIRCEKCGAEIVNNVGFCSNCGAPVVKNQAPATVNMDLIECAKCGKTVPKNVNFCTGCGASIAEQQAPVQNVAEETAGTEFESTTVETESVAEVVDSKSNTSESRFCTNCGTKLDADALFCTECGAKVE